MEKKQFKINSMENVDLNLKCRFHVENVDLKAMWKMNSFGKCKFNGKCRFNHIKSMLKMNQFRKFILENVNSMENVDLKAMWIMNTFGKCKFNGKCNLTI